MKRETEQFRENLRDHILANINNNARLMDTDLMLHVIDAEALEKSRVRQYCAIDKSTSHFINRTEDQAQMEKARDTRIDVSKLENHADFRQIGLDQSLEKIYFDHYGHGSNDSPVPDPPNRSYKCPCGQRYMMHWRTLPLECTKCHRLTPMGEMQRDGVLKRI